MYGRKLKPIDTKEHHEISKEARFESLVFQNSEDVAPYIQEFRICRRLNDLQTSIKFSNLTKLYL